jgi:hypothetical protein
MWSMNGCPAGIVSLEGVNERIRETLKDQTSVKCHTRNLARSGMFHRKVEMLKRRQGRSGGERRCRCFCAAGDLHKIFAVGDERD